MNDRISPDPLEEETGVKLPEGPSKEEKKRLRKLERAEEVGLLDPWERYRILTDFLRQYIDLVELADRKTRFALVLIGAVNAINLVVLVRPELLAGSTVPNRTWMGLYVIAYICISLFLFYHAIRELKPRLASRIRDYEAPSQELLGLRFVGDVAEASRAEYYERWRKAQIGHVNREVAYTIQLIGKAIAAKHQALDSLFNGLLALIFLTAGLLLYLIYIQIWQ